MIESSKMYLLKSSTDIGLKSDVLKKAYKENEREVCVCEEICMKCTNYQCNNYYLYTKQCSNAFYNNKYFETYYSVDKNFISKSFDSFLAKRKDTSLINICIIGGGNLYELYSISTILENIKYSDVYVNVCIIDRFLWPNNLYEWKKSDVFISKNIKTIMFYRGTCFDELKDNDYNFIDIFYFSRCMNPVELNRNNKTTLVDNFEHLFLDLPDVSEKYEDLINGLSLILEKYKGKIISFSQVVNGSYKDVFERIDFEKKLVETINQVGLKKEIFHIQNLYSSNTNLYNCFSLHSIPEQICKGLNFFAYICN